MASAHRAEAERAYALFNAGKYDEALEALLSIAGKVKEQDLRLEMNVALTEYARDPAWHPRRLLERVEGILRAAEAKRKSAAPEKESVDEDGADVWIGQYNKAVLLFQLRQYKRATVELGKLLKRLDALDEVVAMRASFLMLELLMHANRSRHPQDPTLQRAVAQCESIITFIEKPHAFNGLLGEGERKEDEKAHAALVAEFQFRVHLYRAKLELMRGSVRTARKEIKAAFEIYQREFRADDAHARASSGAGATSEAVQAAAAETLSPALIRGGWWAPGGGSRNATAQLLKANLEYLRNNSRKVIKLLDSSFRAGLDETVYLNNMGCVHFRLRRYHSAALHFGRALDAQRARLGGRSLDGVVRRDRHVHGGLQDVGGDARTHHPAQPGTYVAPELELNAGAALLHAGRPREALAALTAATMAARHNPLLWLRLADCCIEEHGRQMRTRTGLAQHPSAPGDTGSSLRALATVGRGDHRFLVLPVRHAPSAETGGAWRSDAGAGAGGADGEASRARVWAGRDEEGISRLESSGAGGGAGTGAGAGASSSRGSLSLEFASKCLRTCLWLVDTLSVSSSSAAGAGAGEGAGAGAGAGADAASDAASEAGASEAKADGEMARGAMSTTSLATVRCYALCRLAYVLLALGDSVGCVAACNRLLGSGDLHALDSAESDSLRACARHYKADAALQMEDVTTAKNALNEELARGPDPPPAHTAGAGTGAGGAGGGSAAAAALRTSETAATSRAVLYANLANVHLARGEGKQAQHALERASALAPSHPAVLRARTLLQLREGNPPVGPGSLAGPRKRVASA